MKHRIHDSGVLAGRISSYVREVHVSREKDGGRFLGAHCNLLVGRGCQADVAGEIDFMPEPDQQSNRGAG